MIEEKIARLPPELRQEVEDFVDYLLKRYGDYLEQQKDTSSSVAPVMLAQETDPSSLAENNPSNALLALDVQEAAGGQNDDEGLERNSRNILEWID